MEVAVINSTDGSVNLYTIPAKFNTPTKRQVYIEENFITSSCEWIMAKEITFADYRMDDTHKKLTKAQARALALPCPECEAAMEHVGDLADFDHDIVICTNNEECDYALLARDN